MNLCMGELPLAVVFMAATSPFRAEGACQFEAQGSSWEVFWAQVAKVSRTGLNVPLRRHVGNGFWFIV